MICRSAQTRSAPGARGRTRTGTALRPRDFKSLASTNFATRARVRSRRDAIGRRKHWRRGSESNRRTRLCRPLHDHSATPPRCARTGAGPDANATKRNKQGKRLALSLWNPGAGNESRTRDLNLGKVALYQLSYSRVDERDIIAIEPALSRSSTVSAGSPARRMRRSAASGSRPSTTASAPRRRRSARCRAAADRTAPIGSW